MKTKIKTIDKYQKQWNYLKKHTWLLQKGIKEDLIHVFEMCESEEGLPDYGMRNKKQSNEAKTKMGKIHKGKPSGSKNKHWKLSEQSKTNHKMSMLEKWKDEDYRNNQIFLTAQSYFFRLRNFLEERK